MTLFSLSFFCLFFNDGAIAGFPRSYLGLRGVGLVNDDNLSQ